MTSSKLQPVYFGNFFGLCRCLWIVCHFIDNGENNVLNGERNIITKGHLIFDLFIEYQKFKESIDEFYYCINQIEAGNSLLNPLDFDTNPFAYKVHITNCFYIKRKLWPAMQCFDYSRMAFMWNKKIFVQLNFTSY